MIIHSLQPTGIKDRSTDYIGSSEEHWEQRGARGEGPI